MLLFCKDILKIRPLKKWIIFHQIRSFFVSFAFHCCIVCLGFPDPFGIIKQNDPSKARTSLCGYVIHRNKWRADPSADSGDYSSSHTQCMPVTWTLCWIALHNPKGTGISVKTLVMKAEKRLAGSRRVLTWNIISSLRGAGDKSIGGVGRLFTPLHTSSHLTCRRESLVDPPALSLPSRFSLISIFHVDKHFGSRSAHLHCQCDLERSQSIMGFCSKKAIICLKCYVVTLQKTEAVKRSMNLSILTMCRSLWPD